MSTRIGGVQEVVETGLQIPPYDYVSNAPTGTTDVFTFFIGGSGGTPHTIITIVYTDATKATISTVTRAPLLI